MIGRYLAMGIQRLQSSVLDKGQKSRRGCQRERKWMLLLPDRLFWFLFLYWEKQPVDEEWADDVRPHPTR